MIFGQAIYYFVLLLMFVNVLIVIIQIIKNKKGVEFSMPKRDFSKNKIVIFNNSKFERKIENLILRANIKKYLPGLSSNTIIITSFILGVIGFWFSYKYLNNIFTSSVFFIALFLLPNFILETFANYYSLKIERSFLYFLNILCNFAQLKDDVYFAFEKCIGYIDEPLNSYCRVFVEEVKRGLPVEDALEEFKEKLDNNRFKLFIKNTQLCMKYGGSFLKLAINNLELIKQLQIEKARRKNETILGKTLIYVMMGINIILAVYMFSIYPETIIRIRTDFYGQVVILINTVNLLITFYLSLKLQKLDY